MKPVHISTLYEAAQLNAKVVTYSFTYKFKIKKLDSRANENFFTTCAIWDVILNTEARWRHLSSLSAEWNDFLQVYCWSPIDRNGVHKLVIKVTLQGSEKIFFSFTWQN